MDVKWIEFFKQLGFTSLWAIILILIIGFLAKKLFDFFIDKTIDSKKSDLGKELEQFKQELSTEAQIHKLDLDKTLEEYKNSLQQVSQEHQIRFSKLHADRAETIKTLFSKLVKLEDAMISFVAPLQWSGEPSPSEKSNIAANEGNDFLSFFHNNEILFNDRTCEIINELNFKFKTAYDEHVTHLKREKEPHMYKNLPKDLDPYFDILKNEVPKLKKLLTDDFRKTLGVL